MEMKADPEVQARRPRVDDTCEVFVFNPEVVAAVKRDMRDVSATAALFKALADESRCVILTALTMSRELCVCDLAEIAGLALPTVSHHLRKLKQQDLVASRREGKLVFYRLTSDDARLLLRVAATRRAVAT